MSFWNRDAVPTDQILREVVDGKLKEVNEECKRLRQELRELKAVSGDLIREHAKVTHGSCNCIQCGGLVLAQVYVNSPSSSAAHRPFPHIWPYTAIFNRLVDRIEKEELGRENRNAMTNVLPAGPEKLPKPKLAYVRYEALMVM